MRRGVPLNDDDRRPWLQAIRQRLDAAVARGENVVLACSALKHAYQEYLQHDVVGQVHYVHLRGSEELIAARLAGRKGHFMHPALLHSQFEALEPPGDALQIDVTPAPEVIAAEIRRRLGL
jgi:gluconokinase